MHYKSTISLQVSYPALSLVVCLLEIMFLSFFSFCVALEQACIDTVDGGERTKDLAGCIYGLQK